MRFTGTVGSSPAGLFFMHSNHLGTTQVITNTSQQIVWQADYQPFGTFIPVVEDIENQIRLPGQFADRETGFNYNSFRDYAPSLGRYVQNDPIGIFGGYNTYGYAAQNPIFFTDAAGLFFADFEAAEEITRRVAATYGKSAPARYAYGSFRTMGFASGSTDLFGPERGVMINEENFRFGIRDMWSVPLCDDVALDLLTTYLHEVIGHYNNGFAHDLAIAVQQKYGAGPGVRLHDEIERLAGVLASQYAQQFHELRKLQPDYENADLDGTCK